MMNFAMVVIIMPRKKKTIVEETIPDDTPETGEDLTDVICVLTKVYKVNAGGKSFCFQTTEPVDEVSIQVQYPTGGKFIVQEFNNLNHVIGTTHIDIEPKPIATSVNGNNGDIHTRLLLDELAHNRMMVLKLIEGLAAGRSQQQEHTPLGELAQAMQVVNEMSGKSNPVDLIVKGMELGMKSSGGTDWKAELVSAAKDVIPAAVQLVGNRQIPQGQTPMMITAPTPSLMKTGIDWLKPQILAGMTTDLAIGWVIQNAKDPLCNQLIANALKDNALNSFIEVDPELANEPYKTWFESAIQLLKDEYAAQQGNDTDDSQRGNGNSSDVADNEKVSSRKSKITKVS